MARPKVTYHTCTNPERTHLTPSSKFSSDIQPATGLSMRPLTLLRSSPLDEALRTRHEGMCNVHAPYFPQYQILRDATSAKSNGTRDFSEVCLPDPVGVFSTLLEPSKTHIMLKYDLSRFGIFCIFSLFIPLRGSLFALYIFL